MKKLDKYIAKNFLVGYLVAFCVLMGLRIVIDLFISLDEFAEHSNLGISVVIRNILLYYGANSLLYFRDFAGMIMVTAASFALGRMIRCNELVAIMASGVSLKRVMVPIVVLSVILTGVLVVDQEIMIPEFSRQLVRKHDEMPGQEKFEVQFIDEADGSLIFSEKFDIDSSTLYKPLIIKRKIVTKDNKINWEFLGLITADSATYKIQRKGWELLNGKFAGKQAGRGFQKIDFYPSDVAAADIPIKCEAKNKSLLSWMQLSALAKLGRIKDASQIYSQMHFHVTEPIINLIMLMLCLPVLICRDPKTMKTAVIVSFALTGLCFIVTFVCKMFSTEVVFGVVAPELWAWLPIFIFVPAAFLEIDSMKT